MRVEEVIENVARAHELVVGYRDSGTVKVSRPNGVSVEATFETVFERSERFSFSIEVRTSFGHSSTHRILSEGASLKVGDPEWLDSPPASLGAAIAYVTGVSLGVAHFIPSLLLPGEVGGRGLFDWPLRRLAGSEALNGEQHVVVEVGDSDWCDRIYVHEPTWSVRRIISTRSGGGTQIVDYSADLV